MAKQSNTLLVVVAVLLLVGGAFMFNVVSKTQGSGDRGGDGTTPLTNLVTQTDNGGSTSIPTDGTPTPTYSDNKFYRVSPNTGSDFIYADYVKDHIKVYDMFVDGISPNCNGVVTYRIGQWLSTNPIRPATLPLTSTSGYAAREGDCLIISQQIRNDGDKNVYFHLETQVYGTSTNGGLYSVFASDKDVCCASSQNNDARQIQVEHGGSGIATYQVRIPAEAAGATWSCAEGGRIYWSAVVHTYVIKQTIYDGCGGAAGYGHQLNDYSPIPFKAAYPIAAAGGVGWTTQ